MDNSNLGNIALIGMPGAGKSTVGVVAAKRLGMGFVDSDLVIQQRAGHTLPELIALHGVEGFWQIEGAVNASLRPTRSVIATGGSAIYDNQAMRHLAVVSTVIYLKISFESVERRVGDLGDRGVTMRAGQTLRELYDERVPRYEHYADLTVDVEGLDLKDAVLALSAAIESLA